MRVSAESFGAGRQRRDSEENGWDILQQNVLPLQVLREAQQFVVGSYLGGSTQVVEDPRTEAYQEIHAGNVSPRLQR